MEIALKPVKYSSTLSNDQVDKLPSKNISNNDKLSLLVSVLLEKIYTQEESETISNSLSENGILNLDNIEFKDEIKKQLHSFLPNKRDSYSDIFIDKEKIGEGAFSDVFKSFHRLDGKEYAIKKIYFDDETEDILNEIKLWASFSHENIVKYHFSWPASSYSGKNLALESLENLDAEKIPAVYVQMELCDFSLKDYIEGNSEKSINDIFEYWKSIVSAVNFLHSNNIIHRDIKPSNIFIKNKVIKLGDFGLSKQTDGLFDNTKKSVDIGYGYYRAPEIDSGYYDSSIDIYSIGVILLELLTQFKTVFQKIKELPDMIKTGNLSNLITCNYNNYIKLMINKTPSRRPLIRSIFENIEFANIKV